MSNDNWNVDSCDATHRLIEGDTTQECHKEFDDYAKWRLSSEEEEAAMWLLLAQQLIK